MLLHVVIEFLDRLNSIDGTKTLVTHEPMGLLLGQVTELLERGLQKVIFNLFLIKFNSGMTWYYQLRQPLQDSDMRGQRGLEGGGR